MAQRADIRVESQDYLTAGEQEDHVVFDTDHGKAGMLVCWDMAWSEAFRSVRLPCVTCDQLWRPAHTPLPCRHAAPPTRRRARHLVSITHRIPVITADRLTDTLPLPTPQPDLLDRDRRDRARALAQPRLGGDLPRLARRHPRVRERVLRRVCQLRRPQERGLHRPQRRHPPVQGQGRRDRHQ